MKIWFFIISVFLIVIILILFLIPAKEKGFSKLFRKGGNASKSLEAFMRQPLKSITINNIVWKYLVSGTGDPAILFIHGMGGAYNIWWQQVDYFDGDYKIITFTLPEEINSLESAASGISEILDAEHVKRLYIVGTSMGGYIAQYLTHKMSHKIEKAVYSNTFPPNAILKRKNRFLIRIVPYIPEIILRKSAEKQLREKLLPAAKNSELLAGLLPGLPFSKKQFINRARIVFEPFIPRPESYEIMRIPKLIIESDNDPLIDLPLREQLKNLYKNAAVYTFKCEGHFPYINAADEFNRTLKQFFEGKNAL